MTDKAVWDMQVFAVICSAVAFIFGAALGGIIVHGERSSLWLEHAEASCHPFAVEHADFGSFYFECAEIEHDL
jgi:hypothetical protein